MSYFNDAGNRTFHGSSVSGTLLIPPKLKEIGESAFVDAKHECINFSISNLEIIQYRAFSKNTFPLDLVFPPSLQLIGSYAFSSSNVVSIDFTSCTNLAMIDHYAFVNCLNLTGNITFPASLVEIGGYSFYNTSIEGISFDIYI